MKKLYTSALNLLTSFKTTLRLALLSLVLTLILSLESYFQPYANYNMGGTSPSFSWQNTSSVYDISSRTIARNNLFLKSVPISENYTMTYKDFH
jgi:hypothetical protein